jgi:translocation and assembly module TamB
MTKRTKNILLTIGASIAGLIVLLIVAAIIILQSGWFQNYVKNKIVASLETATGGVAEVGSFRFDLKNLTLHIRDFTLHGTEPKTAAPLLYVQMLELKLKLFSGIAHTVDLAYVEVQKPQVDLIISPNGKTNIPEPKAPSTSSNDNTLQTLVDLKINKFLLQNGLIAVADQSTPFNAKGENLHLLLNYDPAHPQYAGSLTMDPMVFQQGTNPPLNATLELPLVMGPDSLSINNARLKTPQSQIVLNASLQNPNAPIISAHLQAGISLPEMQRSMALAMDTNAPGAPKVLTADLAVQLNENTKALQIQSAHVALGQTTLEASGSAAPGNGAIQFAADVALGQLARLMNVSSLQVNGDLTANGTATLDAQDNYAVNGTINSRGLAVRSGSTAVSNITVQGPFHADPYLISINWLNVTTLGGDLRAKVFIEQMQQASVEADLRNFSLPVLAAVATGKHLGYSGTLNGQLIARADLKAKGMTGDSANAHLTIVPGTSGVPISGRIDGTYSGRIGVMNLARSYVAFPHSRLDLSGAINHQLDISLISHNLNDFLPAANLEATTPETSLPVQLGPGGAATVQAQITGDLSAPHVSARAAVTNFDVQQKRFDRLAVDLAASPSGASIQNGLLAGPAAQAKFDASIGLFKWAPLPRSPLSANATMTSADIGALAALAGESSIQASGQLSADAHIRGTYGDPLGNASLQIANGSVDQQPFSKLAASVSLADQLVTLSNVELDTAGGRIGLNATFRHPRDSFSTGTAQFQVTGSGIQLADVKPLQEKSPGAAGNIQLTASGAASIRKQGNSNEVAVSNIAADFAATGLKVQGQDAGSLTATAHTTNGTVVYKLGSDFAGSNIAVSGHTALQANYPTTADASIQNLSLSKVLQITGESQYPVSGTLTANAHVSGTMQSPAANLGFNLANANVYAEPINSLKGQVDYSPTLVRIPAVTLDVPAGSVTLKGSFSHPANDFNAGALQLSLNSSDLQLAKIRHLEHAQPGLAGTLHLAANVAANVTDAHGTRGIRLADLNANIAANGLKMNDRQLGDATFVAHTSGQDVTYRLNSQLAQASIQGSGTTRLADDYPTRASISFGNIKYSNLQPFIATESGPEQLFDASLAGQASVNGPITDVNRLAGRLELTTVDVQTHPTRTPTGGPAPRRIDLQNNGAIVITLDHSVVRVQHLKISGPDTNVSASGEINLRSGDNPIGIQLGANLNLALLQDIDREFYSSGTVAMNAVVRGNFSQPLVNGDIVLKNANVNYAQAPNGLSNANGVILLNGTSATIQNLTAESGGGKIAATGFVAFGGPALNFNLRATANKVLTHYSGIDIVTNANVSAIGSSRRSLIGGSVTIQRIAYNSQSDMGSILSSASGPPSAPSAPSAFLSGMRLDIHVLTAPDLRVVSTYTNKLDVFADLTVRGTAETPGILGRVVVTNGQLVFFGNTYTVDTGTINFYNPNAIQPIINISLETIAQGVDVVIGVTGPMDDLNLSYRSDPPLTFEQIVELLATNTTPANAQIAAQQPAPPQQSFSQMGESALLGQAIANPLASRVQRVFGLTQFKIDPSIAGNNGQPSARVTLQQKVTSNVTFTYIQDITQANSEIVRVEWDFSNALSAVALRDFNGNVSVELFYKFKRR